MPCDRPSPPPAAGAARGARSGTASPQGFGVTPCRSEVRGNRGRASRRAPASAPRAAGRRGRAADRGVALRHQRVPRQGVAVHVGAPLRRPALRQRVDLDQAGGRVALEHLQPGAGAAMIPLAPGDPAVQPAQRPRQHARQFATDRAGRAARQSSDRPLPAGPAAPALRRSRRQDPGQKGLDLVVPSGSLVVGRRAASGMSAWAGKPWQEATRDVGIPACGARFGKVDSHGLQSCSER